MRTSRFGTLFLFASLALVGCPEGESATSETFTDTTGDGDGDPGDGDGDPGDGDGDPSGDGDGDPSGDGDGDPSGDGDGDGDPVCGDGVVNGDEECDDGNPVDTDACLNSCLSASCGDGIVQEGVEACDDGNTDDGDGCTNACAAASCGDGVMNEGEACDDGNADDTDACTNTCMTAICGDSIVQAGVEDCDDGNDVDTDDCKADCTTPSCGDGIVWEGNEACDDANDVETDDCLADCTAASCGDGIVWEGNEVCDDGVNDGSYDGCEMGCDALAAYCGDNNVDMQEECDDGNNVDNDSCTNDCNLPPCGNNCFGPEGCLTGGGRCIRLTCAQADHSATVCDSCFGWDQVTYQDWMNGGYCADVIAKYRQLYQTSTKCGDSNLECCASAQGCGGGDNAWHFHNGASNYYVGPCLGCANDVNCTFWNNTTTGTYSRLTACERP